MRLHHLAAIAAVLAAMVTGCGGTAAEPVGPVSLDVPGDWVVDDRVEASGDLLEERRWHPPDGRSATLQVIVGCGEGDAEQLRLAFSQAYQVRDELQATDVEVPGLDSAQRVELALAADPLGGTAGAFRLDSLYGAGGGGLVVVELGGPTDDHDPELVEQVLGSVEVDDETLAVRCADAG